MKIKTYAIWQFFAEFPFHTVDEEKGYKTIFRILSEIYPLQAYYLYALDETRQQLLLQSMNLISQNKDDRQEMVPDNSEKNLSHPPLNLKLLDKYKEMNLITESEGKFLNIPLRIQDREFIGILLAGPVIETKIKDRILQQIRHFALAAAPAVSTLKTVDSMESKIRTLQSRTNISQRMIGSALEVNRFVDLLLDLALTASQSDAGFVAILDDDKTKLSIRAHKNLPPGFLENINLQPQNGLFEWASEFGETLIVRDYDFIANLKIKSIIAVPLVEKNELLGVFSLLDYKINEDRIEFNLTILSTFIEQIKLVLNNSKLFEQFTERYSATLEAMSKAYDMHSPATVGHSQRVSKTAAEIALQLGLSPSRIKNISMAGEIHDIGFCGITDISESYHVDYNHTIIGANMVEVLPISSEIVEGIRSHHEWYDGWGFPQGLKGQEIPLSARIIAVAEYYVEATSNKTLQKAQNWGQFREELQIRRNKQFDPLVVDALISAVEQKRKNAGTDRIEPCWIFKGEPENICKTCPAWQKDKPCWTFQHVQCHKHGDPSCESCFIFKEWKKRMRQ
ncbi:MAG: HD domain-containing protein [Actinobacteria bacterium]|nr:HD domain-containing protein [Actinomycetota bacterium]